MKLPSALLFALAAAFAAGGLGCAAQNENYEDHDWTKERPKETGAWREVESLDGTQEEQAVHSKRFELRGVRHDLTMSGKAKPDTRCQCIDVAVGRPGQSKFRWAGERPAVSPNHLVVALSTKKSKCDSSSKNRRPSIQAVDVAGNDMIISIEELTFDRPQALGAIVKKPNGDGGLFVRPAGKGVVYGRSAIAAGKCRIQLRADQRLRVGAKN